MVGYSKWSKVKHSKGSLDVNRGAALGKLVRILTVAARIGGNGPSGKSRLRPADQIAWPVHLPESHLLRAIQKNFGKTERFTTQKTFTKPAHPAAPLHAYDAPEDHDNTRNVHSNNKFPEETLLRFAA